MKNKINNYVSIIILMVFSLTFSSCLEEEVDFGEDSSKVIPKIFDFAGPTLKFIEETGTYSVTSRGGSEYIWTVTGAELQAIEGRTDKINVYYNQFDELASVSVYEVAANGKQSEVSTINGIKVFGAPCDWRLEMQDSYGDGWNGASLSLEFDGFNGGEYTIAGASLTEIIAVPNGSLIDVSFSSGAWDSEITFQLYDGSGTLILEGGPTPDTGNIYSETNTCP